MKRLSIGLSCMILAASGWADIQRTADGTPDLSGTYNVSTLTPLQRPEEFGENLFLTENEAAKIAEKQASDRATAHKDSDPDRTAPPSGGDGSPGAAGNVGGYNLFWIDNGERAFELDGKFRTSIITHPKNGRQPTMTAEGQQRVANFLVILRENTGSAWWLDQTGPGPYDNMEMRPNGERCLLSFGSTSGPPMLPSAYNNLKRIVQTDTHVMILAEMIHDARVIRLNSAHRPAGIESWMGDSIGHWEGETLVVDTTNFGSRPALLGADKNLHVIERFSRMENGDLKYSFTVDNPDTWEASWGGEYPWPATRDKLYEYACHEGNYALGNIMRGARLLEQDIEGARAGGEE